MTAQPATTRGRSLPAALLGALAVLAALFVVPGGQATIAPSPSLGTAATVRGTAPLGTGLRENRDQARVVPRRGTRTESAAAAHDGRTDAGHGPVPAGVLAAVVALAALVAVAAAAEGRTGRLSRRTPGSRRDRAPPALALA